MQNRLKSILTYFSYWLLFFQIGRLLFFLITREHALQYSFNDLAQCMLHGLWLDMSMAAYFTLLLCVLMVGGLFSPSVFQKIFRVFHRLILAICCLIIISNAVLYTYWSGPLDYNALKYLKTPAEAAASINWILMILPLVLGICFFLLFNTIFLRLNFSSVFVKPAERKVFMAQLIALVVMSGVLIIPIRGGIGIVPVNLSFVYFHKNIYPNHAAYNPIWNVIYSIATTSDENNYVFMDDKIALQKFKELHAHSHSSQKNYIIKNKAQPNIIVIVLESYLSKLVGLKYKGKEVIPNFNALTKNGIYFSNLYASGDRSDKGLVAIFSGYPAMPKSAVVQFPEKFASLPSVFKDAKMAKYHTSFYYGGNLDFANLRSYFISAGVEKLVTNSDLNSSLTRGKWGVHDEFMFEKYLKDLHTHKQPFFSGLFTLSNHEPYDLPGNFYFGKQNGDEEYMSAARYTDDCLGKFIEGLKISPLWENSVVVIVADHGVARLGINEIMAKEKFHIPMVLTGGLIGPPQTVSRVCSQTDIPLLILSQCAIKRGQSYPYSNDISQEDAKPFASYFFNNGFGFVTQNCTSLFDNVTRKYWTNSCPEDSNGVYGKAYLQVLSKDFSN